MDNNQKLCHTTHYRQKQLVGCCLFCLFFESVVECTPLVERFILSFLKYLLHLYPSIHGTYTFCIFYWIFLPFSVALMLPSTSKYLHCMGNSTETYRFVCKNTNKSFLLWSKLTTTLHQRQRPYQKLDVLQTHGRYFLKRPTFKFSMKFECYNCELKKGKTLIPLLEGTLRLRHFSVPVLLQLLILPVLVTVQFRIT